MSLRLYDFKCSCGRIVERLIRGDEKIHCLFCGGEMERQFPLVRVNMGPAGAHGYFDENLGAYVSTNAERKRLCREQGVTPQGDTPKPDGEAWV